MARPLREAGGHQSSSPGNQSPQFPGPLESPASVPAGDREAGLGWLINSGFPASGGRTWSLCPQTGCFPTCCSLTSAAEMSQGSSIWEGTSPRPSAGPQTEKCSGGTRPAPQGGWSRRGLALTHLGGRSLGSVHPSLVGLSQAAGGAGSRGRVETWVCHCWVAGPSPPPPGAS